MKKKRQDALRNIIEEHEVSTQGELQRLLLEQGFHVTQATISRDIKELQILKHHLSSDGKYVYAIGDRGKSHTLTKKKQPIILNGLTSYVDSVGNMVVIKCHTGMAQAVCASIDDMRFLNVVGTIAGDDTIFILMRSEETALEFVEMFKQRFVN